MSLKPFFPALSIYHITKPLDLEKFEERLAEVAYSPCDKHTMARVGFVSALHDTAKTLSYWLGQQHILLRVKIEERKVPPKEIRRHLDEKVKKMEEETGKNVGKKQQDDLKEEVIKELLPRAFSNFKTIPMWLDLVNQTLVVGSASANISDLCCALLRKAIGSLPVVPLSPRQRLDDVMTGWLRSEFDTISASFMLGGKVVTGTTGAQAKVVERGGVWNSAPVNAALSDGHRVMAVSMCWRGIMSFNFNESTLITGIDMPGEYCLLPVRGGSEDAIDAMAANFTIAAGLLADFISELRDLIGDESKPQIEESDITADDVRALLEEASRLQQVGVTMNKADAMLAIGAGPIKLAKVLAKVQESGDAFTFERPDDDQDPIYGEAKAFVIESRRGSTSSIQRQFKIGYNRAARIIEQLENKGVVSAPNGNGARDVLHPGTAS